MASSSPRLVVFQVMFVRELAARLPHSTPVVACAVNPGYCRSSLFRAMEHRWYMRWILAAAQRMMVVRPTEEGSKTLVHPVVASDAHAQAMHGRYISSCEVVEESDFLFTPQGKAVSTKLWVRRPLSALLNYLGSYASYVERNDHGLVSRRQTRLGNCCQISVNRGQCTM